MKKVIIIGGGVAGVAAAKHLVESKKFEVMLLEANSRLGGRVHTELFGHHFVELGAQSVHGQVDNAVFQIASPLNLFEEDSADDMENIMFLTSSGKVVDARTKERIKNALFVVLNGPEDDSESRKDSVWQWVHRKLEQLKESGDKNLSQAEVDAIHRIETSFLGADNWFEASLGEIQEYKICSGNQAVAWKPPAGYTSLLSVILSNKPTSAPNFQPEIPDWIQLGKEVTKIEFSNSNEAIHVVCADSSEYRCDHVICTVSLGVLKHTYQNLFHPPLSPTKVKAIERLGYGCVNKVHLDFGTRWWLETSFKSLIWDEDDEDNQKIRGKYWDSEVSDLALRQDVNGLPLWCRGIVLLNMSVSHPTALLFWFAGPPARYIETLSDDEVSTALLKVLKRFFKTTKHIPEPIGVLRSKWHSSPWTRGSYSFRSLETEEHDVWARDLAEPVFRGGSPVVCFAGEATHNHYFATVHGAYETGVREAERLIQISNL